MRFYFTTKGCTIKFISFSFCVKNIINLANLTELLTIMESSVLPTLKRRGETFYFPADPKKKRRFECKISKWKKDRILNYKVRSFCDEDEEEFVIITQRLNVQNSNSVVLSPEKAELLVEDIKKYLAMYNRRRYKSEMQEIFLRMIEDRVFDIRKEMCEGCLEGYPSQLHHYCFITEAKQFVEDAFSNLIEIVDEAEANVICNKTLKFNGHSNFTKTELLADKEWTSELKSKIVCFLDEPVLDE